MIEELRGPLHGGQDLRRPGLHVDRPALAYQLQARLAPRTRHRDVVAIELRLFGRIDLRARGQRAQCGKGLEKAQLVLVDADRIQRADVQRPHLHVLDAGPAQSLGRPFPGAGDPLRANERVVLVLDLQDVGVELPPLAVDLDTQCRVLGAWRRDRRAEVTHVIVETVHGYGQLGLGLVAVAKVGHPQTGGIGCVQRPGRQLVETVPAASGDETLGDGRRYAEQVVHDPAVAPVVAQ